jgi:hypothetical protein
MFDSNENTMEALHLPRRFVFHVIYSIKKTNCELIQNEKVLQNDYHRKKNVRMMD